MHANEARVHRLCAYFASIGCERMRAEEMKLNVRALDAYARALECLSAVMAANSATPTDVVQYRRVMTDVASLHFTYAKLLQERPPVSSVVSSYEASYHFLLELCTISVGAPNLRPFAQVDRNVRAAVA